MLNPPFPRLHGILPRAGTRQPQYSSRAAGVGRRWRAREIDQALDGGRRRLRIRQ